MGDPRSLTHRHKHSPSPQESVRDGQTAVENGGGGGGGGAAEDTNGHSSSSSHGEHKGKRGWPLHRTTILMVLERRRATLIVLAGIFVVAAAASFAALPAALGAMRIAGRLRRGPTTARPSRVRPRLLVAPTPWSRKRKRPSSKGRPPYVPGRTVHDLTRRADPDRLLGNRFHFETDDWADDCVAMRAWQLGHHPTCNAMHEVHIPEMKGDAELVNGGDYRDVWRFLDYDGTTARAFKSMQLERQEEGHRVYEMMKTEAVAMDHLTKSPYVSNVYGFCALSALYAFSTGGTFKKLAKKGLLTSKEKLELSLQVVKATRDVHDLDDEGVVTMTVADISSGQFVKNDDTGIYQLADLNVLRFMTWEKDDHEPCKFTNAPSAGYVRSPEEYSRAKFFDEKIDIWAMGNVLHFLLTGDYAFCTDAEDSLSLDTVIGYVKKGKTPPSYAIIERDGDAVEREILNVVKHTRATRKEDRWPAKRAAEYLDEVWRKVQSGKIVGTNKGKLAGAKSES